MTVIVQEARRDVCVVVGKIVKPGCYAWGNPTTVLKPFANAGRFQEFAKVNRGDVLRRMEDGAQSFLALNCKQVIKDRKLSQNVDLKSGHRMVVP